MARGNRIRSSYVDEFVDENMFQEIEEKTTESSSAEVKKNGPETKNGIVVNSLHVNARKEPSYESDVLELLRKGDKVIILGKEGEFYKISTSKNKIAYISSKFIKEE